MFQDIQEEFRELDRIYFSKTEEMTLDDRKLIANNNQKRKVGSTLVIKEEDEDPENEPIVKK